MTELPHYIREYKYCRLQSKLNMYCREQELNQEVAVIGPAKNRRTTF